MAENNDELLDYEEQEDQEDQVADGIAGDTTARKDVRGTYVSIHSSGFRDFLLKPELLRAIVDCGFEHPSEGRFVYLVRDDLPSVLCRCWLGGRKGIRPVKRVVWCWCVVCLGQGSDLHMAQLMPLRSGTVSCFSKIQIGFTFLVLAHLGS